MSIRHIVTRGYGNGTFAGTIADVVMRGYISLVEGRAEGFGVAAVFDARGQGVLAALDATGQGVLGIIEESFGVSAILDPTGQGVVGALDDTGQGVLGEI